MTFGDCQTLFIFLEMKVLDSGRLGRKPSMAGAIVQYPDAWLRPPAVRKSQTICRPADENAWPYPYRL